jgi:serine/threonine protein kinase
LVYLENILAAAAYNDTVSIVSQGAAMPAAPTLRNAVALVAGIGAYRHRDRIPTLRYAPRDARSLARVLADPEVCAFPPQRVVVLTNRQVRRTELVRRLARWLPEQGQGADLALIYFAGHGVVRRVGGREEGYLLPHDADPDDVVAHGIAMSDLAKWIADVNARAVVLCLDCCHAGNMLPADGLTLRGERDMELAPSVLQQLSGRGRFLIASCDRGQKSLEAEELRHGLFTYHLLRGLVEAGDRDGDGRVSVAELFGYVSTAVSRDARERFGHEQTPWTSAVYNEDVFLSTVRPGRRSPPLQAGRSTQHVEAGPTSAEDADLVERLRELRRRPDADALPLLFRCLAHRNEAVRGQAGRAFRALGWEAVSRAAERLVDPASIDAMLDGLAALEAHREVVALLDRLVGLLRGGPRDRAAWLLERKRLALERERLAEVFRAKQSTFEIVRVLGPGFYTAAYLARQELTGLDVVVRVLRPEYAQQPLVRSRFIELGAQAVRVVHQNLVLTREVRSFADSSLYFAVRDFVDGPTLREVLAAGRRFEPLQAVKILRQVLDALTPLLHAGMVHGGIKPSNIFLTRNDHVVLGDPSLPLAQGLALDLPRLAYDFRYAPPELFRSGAALSPAADVYSLGCVAHELFRGQPPFVSDSPFELIACHDRDAIPAGPGNVLDRWLGRLLAKDAAARPRLAEVVVGLAEVEDSFRPPLSLAPSAEARPRMPSPEATMAPAVGLDAPSVHLLREQSLIEFEGRESIVPATGADGGPYTVAPEEGAAPGASRPPAAIPGYEILSELGRGGMGAVYKARQVALNRVVALKMILSAWHAGASERQRFRTEAEAIGRLQHPNILQVYDLGEHEGMPFLVMEYCSGGSLARRLRETPLPPREAAHLVETLAEAMQVAHQAQIVHRDLKPANVLLAEDGIPKITDFGLAKRLDEVGQTHTGAVVGSPPYMAPEQAQGRKTIGPATDIYALGAILYECLTGRPPFRAGTALDTIMQVVSEEPVPPRRLNPQVPADLEAICLKCLEKEPARRYASAADLADDLRCFLEGAPAVASPARRKWWPFGRRS